VRTRGLVVRWLPCDLATMFLPTHSSKRFVPVHWVSVHRKRKTVKDLHSTISACCLGKHQDCHLGGLAGDLFFVFFVYYYVHACFVGM
jgi:hypothetical protein